MRPPLGRRSPVEQEHDLPPIRALVVRWPLELPGLGGRVELVDDGGQIPVFELEANAGVCAAELHARIDGLELAVVTCWRGWIAEHLYRGRAPLTDEEVEQLTRRSYTVEGRSTGPADALQESRQLAARIVAGWQRRFAEAIGAPA